MIRRNFPSVGSLLLDQSVNKMKLIKMSVHTETTDCLFLQTRDVPMFKQQSFCGSQRKKKKDK